MYHCIVGKNNIFFPAGEMSLTLQANEHIVTRFKIELIKLFFLKLKAANAFLVIIKAYKNKFLCFEWVLILSNNFFSILLFLR